MATPSVILQYWNDTAWVKAATHAGNSAVLICTVTKSLNNPTVAELILSNRSKDASSTDTAKSTGALSDPTGKKATLFREFQDVRLLDNETGSALFRGRIYHIRNQYDFQYGSTVKLIAKDMLQELVDIPIDNAPPPLRSITMDSNANSRSKVIALIVNGLSSNFKTDDATKFEASAHNFSAEELKTDDPSQSGGTFVWDIVTGQQQALALVNDFAKQDPHDANVNSDEFGYDYYVDANVVSYALSSNADSGKVPLHYFKRGSRPHATNIPDYGITLEYPSAGWGGQSNFRKAMLSDAEFTNPNGAFFTSILAHFEDKGSSGDDDISNRKIHGVDNYELVKGNIPATLDGAVSGLDDNLFAWTGKRIQYIDDGYVNDGDNSEEDNRRINPDNDTVTNEDNVTIWPGQSMNPDNPLLLFESGQALPCATVHFQSGIGTNVTNDAEFLVLSNVYNFNAALSSVNQVPINWTDPQGNTIRFRPFPANPTGTNVVRLHAAKSQNTDGDTFPYIIITKDARAVDKHDINKPHRVHIRDMESYDNIRKSMAGILNRASRASVTIGKVRTSRYPYTKVLAHAGSSLNTRSGNTITLGTNALTDAEGDVAGNNPTVFGAKKGMVIAQLKGTNEGNTAIERYSYISNFPAADQVTYGTLTNGTDTSDTNVLDVGKDLAFFIPLETGHMVRLKNKLYGVDYNVLVQKIVFDYSPGVLTTQVEGVGINNATVGGVGIVDAADVNVRIVGGEEDKGYSVNLPPSSQVWKIDDGNIAPFDANHIAVESTVAGKTVTLTTLTDNKIHQVDVADGGAAVGGYTYDRLEIGATTGAGGGHADFVHTNIDDTGPYIIFFRTKGSAYKSRKLQAVAVQRKIQSGTTRFTTGGKIHSEIASPNDVVIGQALKQSSGKCVLQILGGVFGSGWPLDITTLGNNRMTNALMKKGAQPFTTDLLFTKYPESNSSLYNKFAWKGPSANTAQISFGQDATNYITINDGNSDADFTSLGGEDWSTGLYASTTYYAFLTIPTSGNASVGVTNDWKVPFQDDKVLLATVTVAPSAPNNDNNKGASPSILPIAGKHATLSAVNISANTILVDHITAGSITAAKLEAEMVIANKFVTLANVGESGGPAGIKISAAGIQGFSGGQTQAFKLDPATGAAQFGSATVGTIPWSLVGDDNSNKPANNAQVNPANLAALDSTANTKLAGINAGAEVNPANLAALDATANNKLAGITAGAEVNPASYGGFSTGDDGKTRLFLGFDSSGDYIRDIKRGIKIDSLSTITGGDAESPTYAGLAADGDSDCIVDKKGIMGFYRASGSTTIQFYIRADTGAAYLGAGTIKLDANGIELSSGASSAGYFRSGTKAYGASEAGFFLGRSGSAYQFDIGDGTQYLRWSGSQLLIGGDIIIGGDNASTAVTDEANEGANNQAIIDNQPTRFLRFYAPFGTYQDHAFMYRLQSGSGYDKGTFIVNMYNDTVWVEDLIGSVSGNTKLGAYDQPFLAVHTEQLNLNTPNNNDEFITLAVAETTGGSSSSAKYTLTFPSAAPTGNKLIQTDSSGNLSFIDVPTSGGSGTVTEVTVGTGLDVSSGTSTPYITLDLSEFTDMTGTVNGAQDELILLDNGAERRKLVSEITLSDFNNDSGWTSNTGDITSVLAGNGMTGGGYSGSATLTMGTPSTLTDSTSNAVTYSSHTHAVTGLGGEANAANTLLIKRGLFSGDGESAYDAADAHPTGLTYISHIEITRYYTYNGGDGVGSTGEYDEERRSDRAESMVLYDYSDAVFGDLAYHMSADWTYTRAVYRRENERWYGGRGQISGGSFWVFEEDDYYEVGIGDDDYHANRDGALYMWVAYGR